MMNLFYNTTRFFISFCLLFGFALGQAQDQITLPYTESFENGLGDFTQSTTDDFDWTRHSGGTSSSFIGPDSAADGTYYMYTEVSGIGDNAVANLLLDPFEINSAITIAEVEFQYHMERTSTSSTTTFGSLALQVQESDDTGPRYGVEMGTKVLSGLKQRLIFQAIWAARFIFDSTEFMEVQVLVMQPSITFKSEYPHL